MKHNLLILIFLILLFLNTVSANDGGNHTIFPQWTYYGEIVEHTALIIIALLAIIFLIKLSKKEEGKKKDSIRLMIVGLSLLFLSQLLTNLHHFLIYVFGVWNAIIHHGLLVGAIMFMIYAYLNIFKQE